MVMVAEEGSNVDTQLMSVPFYEDTLVSGIECIGRCAYAQFWWCCLE